MRRSETAKHLAAETELQKSAVKALHGPVKHPSLITNEPRVLVQPTGVQPAINTHSYPHCTPPRGLVNRPITVSSLESSKKLVGVIVVDDYWQCLGWLVWVSWIIVANNWRICNFCNGKSVITWSKQPITTITMTIIIKVIVIRIIRVRIKVC